MKKILVPIDFSAFSDNALAYACKIAMQLKYEIYLLNVQSLPAIDDASMAIELIKTIEDSSNKKLIKKVNEIEETHKSISIQRHFSFGIPSITIKEYIESHDFDLVVLGTKGSSGINKILLGSVAESVSKHSKCPVIIVHVNNVYKPIKYIAVPIDINQKFNESYKIVQKVVDYAQLFDAKLHWFYVNTEKTNAQNDIHFTLEDGKKIDIEIIEAKTIEVGITKYCENHSLDLLVVLKHDYSFIYQLFHHNTFSEILANHSLPIMVIH